MKPEETPIITIAVLAPVERIAEARAESQKYHRLRGQDMPLDSFLVDEVRNAQGELTHYSCEQRLSPDDADHVMTYYRAQFRPGHTPAQVLTVETLDEALQRIGKRCPKHECRKDHRCRREKARQLADAELRRTARRARIAEKAGPS